MYPCIGCTNALLCNGHESKRMERGREAREAKNKGRGTKMRKTFITLEMHIGINGVLCTYLVFSTGNKQFLPFETKQAERL